MSNLLRKEFNQLVWEGIAGPHEGYIAPLMLAGLKPVALIAPGLYYDKEIRLLDEAADAGTIKKEVVLRNIFNDTVLDGRATDQYFYCLPDKEKGMHNLIAFYRDLWKRDMQGFKPEHHVWIGQTLGYTDNDIELFLSQSGDSSRYTPQEVDFLYETSEQRRKLRYSHL